jgi:general secretion pathway protein L
MTEYVVIRLAAEDQAVQWILADSNGTQLSNSSSGSLEQAAAEIGERSVIVLVPSVDVLSTTVHIPARSTAKINAALPFALEENLAEDVEKFHFAVGDRQENGRLPVAVVSKDTLDGWLVRLNDAGIEPTVVAPDSHGLARIPGTLSILLDDDTVMFNDGADTVFSMQNVKPSDVLVFAGQLGETESKNEDEENSGHLIVFCTLEQEESLSHDWIALRHELHSVDINVLRDGVLPKLAVTVAAGHGVNLMQGQYGRKTEYASLFRPWKAAAMMLLALGIIAMALKGLGYYQLQQDESALRAQFNAEYRLIRPGDSREILDPVATVTSLRRSVGGSAAPQVFLPGLRELGSAIAANSPVEIETISYRAGVIDLRLTAPDVATLDNIQKAVSSSGRFNASIQSTDQIADKINGRIQIRESGL